jgi:hypothetical protein
MAERFAGSSAISKFSDGKLTVLFVLVGGIARYVLRRVRGGEIQTGVEKFRIEALSVFKSIDCFFILSVSELLYANIERFPCRLTVLASCRMAPRAGC